MVKHVILDTDIGGDPDDMFALLLALYSPEIKLDLIVTADEHKGHRKNFTKKLLKKLEKNIPVIRGSDLGNTKCCVVDDLVKSCKEEDYLSRIREVVERNEKTHYVCISPQTNLAEFLKSSPFPLRKKVEVLMMGGAINYRHPDKAEHNIRYDVESACDVFFNIVKKKYVLSDTTFRKEIEIHEEHPIYKRIENSPIKNLAIKSMQNFFDSCYPSTLMHDPLTLSCLIDPNLVSFEKKRMTMDEDGRMRLTPYGRLEEVSCAADYEGFMKLLSERLPF